MGSRSDFLQNDQIKRDSSKSRNTIESKRYISFDNTYKGNMTSREAGLMVRDMVEIFENKLK